MRGIYELTVKEKLESEGWKVLSKGYPDFICEKNGSIQLIEVKGPKDKLSKEQEEMITILRKSGLTVNIVKFEEALESGQLEERLDDGGYYVKVLAENRIRIPDSIYQKLKLKEGDLVKVTLNDFGNLLIVPVEVVDKKVKT